MIAKAHLYSTTIVKHQTTDYTPAAPNNVASSTVFFLCLLHDTQAYQVTGTVRCTWLLTSVYQSASCVVTSSTALHTYWHLVLFVNVIKGRIISATDIVYSSPTTAVLYFFLLILALQSQLKRLKQISLRFWNGDFCRICVTTCSFKHKVNTHSKITSYKTAIEWYIHSNKTLYWYHVHTPRNTAEGWEKKQDTILHVKISVLQSNNFSSGSCIRILLSSWLFIALLSSTISPLMNRYLYFIMWQPTCRIWISTCRQSTFFFIYLCYKPLAKQHLAWHRTSLKPCWFSVMVCSWND